jgi:hypothetical protein
MNASKYSLIYRGADTELRTPDADKRVQVNGYAGRGFYPQGILSQVSTYSDSELLLEFICEYVKKTYPKIKITKWMFETHNEVDI